MVLNLTLNNPQSAKSYHNWPSRHEFDKKIWNSKVPYQIIYSRKWFSSQGELQDSERRLKVNSYINSKKHAFSHSRIGLPSLHAIFKQHLLTPSLSVCIASPSAQISPLSIPNTRVPIRMFTHNTMSIADFIFLRWWFNILF